MGQYTKNEVEVTKSTRLQIVTSGYSDRFPLYDTTYRVKVWTENGQSVECSFGDKSKAIGFLVNLLEFSFEDAYEMTPGDGDIWISGKTDRRTTSSRKLTVQQLRAVDLYLKVNHGHGFRPEYADDARHQLAENPLEGDLLAIVLWQIAECDRKNIETWGHKNGQEAT